MITIETKIAKNGSKRYYVRDENGKLSQISRARAEEIEAANAESAIDDTDAEIANAKSAIVETANVEETTEETVEDDAITATDLAVCSAQLRKLSVEEFIAEQKCMTVEEYRAREDAHALNVAKKELKWHIADLKAEACSLENEAYSTARTLFDVINDSFYATDESLQSYAVELENEYNELASKLTTCKEQIALLEPAKAEFAALSAAEFASSAVAPATIPALPAPAEPPKPDTPVELAPVDLETLNRQAKLYAVSGKVFGAISEALTPPVDCGDATADKYESAYQTLKAARVPVDRKKKKAIIIPGGEYVGSIPCKHNAH